MVERLPYRQRRVGHVVDELVGVTEVLGVDLVDVEWQLVVDLHELLVLVLEGHLELRAEDLRVEEVLDPDAESGVLVHVGGADAPLRRADHGVTEEALHHRIQLAVVGHDQVGVAREKDLRGVDPPGPEGRHLLEEHLRVDDATVGDDGCHGGIQHAGGDQAEGEALVTDDDRVTGVVPSLVADDHVRLLGEEIGDLPFSLVTPLGTEDHRRGHERPPDVDYEASVDPPGRSSGARRSSGVGGPGKPDPGPSTAASTAHRGDDRLAGGLLRVYRVRPRPQSGSGR